MLEILTYPALIAVVGTAFCFTMLRLFGIMLVRPHRGLPTAEAEPLPDDNGTYHCAVFGARLFEQKMVDAGIMEAKDMLICENRGCPNCAPTRRIKQGLPQLRPKIKDGAGKVIKKWHEVDTYDADEPQSHRRAVPCLACGKVGMRGRFLCDQCHLAGWGRVKGSV